MTVGMSVGPMECYGLASPGRRDRRRGARHLTAGFGRTPRPAATLRRSGRTSSSSEPLGDRPVVDSHTGLELGTERPDPTPDVGHQADRRPASVVGRPPRAHVADDDQMPLIVLCASPAPAHRPAQATPPAIRAHRRRVSTCSSATLQFLRVADGIDAHDHSSATTGTAVELPSRSMRTAAPFSQTVDTAKTRRTSQPVSRVATFSAPSTGSRTPGPVRHCR